MTELTEEARPIPFAKARLYFLVSADPHVIIFSVADQCLRRPVRVISHVFHEPTKHRSSSRHLVSRRSTCAISFDAERLLQVSYQTRGTIQDERLVSKRKEVLDVPVVTNLQEVLDLSCSKVDDAAEWFVRSIPFQLVNR